MSDPSVSLLDYSLHCLTLGDEDVDIKSTVECFPRCEYCVRFKSTTAFDMSEPNFWGTYFRSTAFGGNSDRLTQSSETAKFYRNTVLNCNKVAIAKAGSVYSPWKNKSYNDVLRKLCNQIAKSSLHLVHWSNYFLYDLLLEYKMRIVECTSDMFFNQYGSQVDMIHVYHCNEYPCLMVYIPKLQKITQRTNSPGGKNVKELITGETNSLISIICAYFVAICNDIAQRIGVPVEIVLRSSFGHNGPSVTETSSSFRVNIGIVPFEYCRVVSSAIFQLYECFLKPLFDLNLKLAMSPEDIDRHNDQIDFYNKIKSKGEKFNVEEWFLDEPLLHILCKIGDSKRSKVSFQLSRMNKYMDLLAHFVSDELSLNASSDLTYIPNYSTPLSNLLNCLVYKISKIRSDNATEYCAIAQMQIPENLYRRELKSFNKSNENIKNDEAFWKIVLSICEKLDGFHCLSTVLESKNVEGLYSNLERANIEFVGRSHSVFAEDGYGSDSDCEAEVEPTQDLPPQHIYCRKIIVTTGIRAINLAHFIALYVSRLVQCEPGVDYTNMYYETAKVVRSITSMETIYGCKEQFSRKSCIKYIDLNHCATFGVHEVSLEMDVDPHDVIIFDYTSAKVSKISEAIKRFVGRVSVIILMSSGLKNEQVGADINPYGTVRIITKDLGLLNELNSLAKASVSSEVLPINLHRIRKAYKAIGAVVTNKVIFINDRLFRYTYRAYKQDDMFKSLSQYTDSLNVIYNLANDNDLREKVCVPLFNSGLENVLLTCLREGNLSEVVDLVPDLCLLADTYSISNGMNSLNLTELAELVNLFSCVPDRVERLFEKYKHDLSFLSWNEDKFLFLTSPSVENIWEDLRFENKIDFDDIVECYNIDSDLVESIVSFYHLNSPDSLFLEDDFNSLFQKIVNKKSDFANDHFLFYDPDFSYEDELLRIHTENSKDSDAYDDESNDHLDEFY